MQVLDIIQSAAAKCGVVSSFSLDDMPGDVIDNGVRILQTEVLPALNCDRTVDITVTSRCRPCEGNTIILKPFQPQQNTIIIGYSKYSLTEMNNTRWNEELHRLRPEWFDPFRWPTDDFGSQVTACIWTTDTILIGGNNPIIFKEMGANIDFQPMRVDSVIDLPSRIDYQYVYRDEFERAVPSAYGIYTTEEYSDHMRILIKGAPTPKILVLPVPLQITNCDQQHPGEIEAPPKFRKYLTDALAVQLAIVYAVSSLNEMKAEAAASLNLIKKNMPQPFHQADVCERIGEYLGRFPLGYGRIMR